MRLALRDLQNTMLAIKLQRIGKKHQPSYRIVVAERRSKMAAPPVEDLGSYNPFTKAMTLDKDRVAYWVKMGAQPTVTAHNFLVSKGVSSGKKVAVKMKKAEKPIEVATTPGVAAAALPAEEEKAVMIKETRRQQLSKTLLLLLASHNKGAKPIHGVFVTSIYQQNVLAGNKALVITWQSTNRGY